MSKPITDAQRAMLRAPLPQEAISQHPTKSFLSTIKAIYVVERLNDVFGIGVWKTRNDVIKEQEIEVKGKKKIMVVMKSTLTISGYDVEIEQFGGNDNDDLGDAYKGAATDALTKIGSYLEIGIDVFKGKAGKASGEPQRMEKPGFCTACGAEGMKAKRPNGSVFMTCPHWQAHKEENVKFKIEVPKPKTKEEQAFIDSLPNQ